MFLESAQKYNQQPKPFSEAKQCTTVSVGGDNIVVDVGDPNQEQDFEVLELLDIETNYNEESDLLTFTMEMKDNDTKIPYHLWQVIILLYPELFHELIEKYKYDINDKRILSQNFLDGKYNKIMDVTKFNPNFTGLTYLMRAVYHFAKERPKINLTDFPDDDCLYLYKKYFATMFCTLNFHVDNEFDYGENDMYIADEDCGLIRKTLGYDMFKGNVDREMKSTKITFTRSDNETTKIIIEKNLTTRLEDCTHSDIFLKKCAYLCHNDGFFFTQNNTPDYVGQIISNKYTLESKTENAKHEFRDYEGRRNLLKRSEAIIEKMNNAALRVAHLDGTQLDGVETLLQQLSLSLSHKK